MNKEIHNQKIERIILDSSAVNVVKVISDQICLELGDLVQVTQKTVANFIIRKRSQSLSAQEMSEFLSENYDLIKALKHATQEAIKAKHNGDNIEFSDVLKLIQTPSVKFEVPSKMARGRKKKNDSRGISNSQSDLNGDAPNAPQESFNNKFNQETTDSKFKIDKTISTPDSP